MQLFRNYREKYNGMLKSHSNVESTTISCLNALFLEGIGKEEHTMGQVAFHNLYKLIKGASTAEFVPVVEQFNREYIFKQRGYLSFE